jgi:mRNA-degrading endonuclease RelE of RelBE toxin-antitoxin system
MRSNVISTPNFEREAKKLIKKYRSLKAELLDLIADLEENPKMGVLISENVYKIRLAVKSKGKGKSGGLRIITYVEVEIIEKEEQIGVYLLSIYDKSDRGNISDQFLEQIIEEIKEDFIESEEE